MLHEPRICKWHDCQKGPNGQRADFTPARADQDFCCADCRKARAMWRQRRGAALVDLLIDGKWKDLRTARAALKRETENAE